MNRESRDRTDRRQTWALAWALAAGLGVAAAARAQSPAPAMLPAPAAPQAFTREAAVRFALTNNPFLNTVRQQYGFGKAAVVLSRTYPYNPIYTGYVTEASGPAFAGVTNHIYHEHYISQEIELRGQGRHRRAAASATASRIDWEVAQQEMAVSVAVIRAYNAVLYRQMKLGLVEENVKLNERLFDQARQAAAAGKGADLTLARIDLDTLRAQRGQARTALAVARSELRRQLGAVDDAFVVADSLGIPLPPLDADALTHLALDQRPDLRARRSAVAEAEANSKLVVANRFGNPSIGPYWEYDPTNIAYWGMRVSMPIPVFNQRNGEILKSKTDVCKVRAEVNQLEVQAALDVRAALARLADARRWLAGYDTEVLPALLKAKQEMEHLVANGEPGADAAKLVALQKSYLKALDLRLDAQFEVSQAQADLALALADPALAVGPTPVVPAVRLGFVEIRKE